MEAAFGKAILGIALAHGPYSFWLENLNPGMNPDATWSALLVASALKDVAVIRQVPILLKYADWRAKHTPNGLAPCPHCPAYVRPDKLGKHIVRVHPGQPMPLLDLIANSSPEGPKQAE